MKSAINFFTKITLTVTMVYLIIVTPAYACRDINGLTDLNCDKKLVIVTFGDSITYGRGDSTGLGYPGRLNLIFPNAIIINLGVPGEDTGRGKIRAGRQLPAIPEADYTIILEGVNDYFVPDQTVEGTRSNLISIIRTARSAGAHSLTSTLTDIKRTTSQLTWVRLVNNAIRSFTQLDYHSLGKSIISGDKLHPNDAGYQRMAEYVANYLLTLSLINKPADSDQDGVFDFAESKYGSIVGLSDSDGDGISDGQEIFTYNSNPNSLDSDGDGLSDNYEVFTLGSDPSSPLPGAPKMKSITPLPLSNP